MKLEATPTEIGFSLAEPGESEWLILHYKATPTDKPTTARLHSIAKTRPPCERPEWRCACGEKK